jgi:transcriptional regulator with XRE-family HTH domain
MIGETIYNLRRKQGLSQEQLAEIIGVSRQTVSKWEGNQSTPDLEKLMALAACFQVSMDVLTGYGSGTTQPVEPVATEPAPKGLNLSRVAGLVLCVLGLISLLVCLVILLVYPQSMDNLGNSFTVIIDGTGAVYGMCILAMVVGTYLLVRKP